MAMQTGGAGDETKRFKIIGLGVHTIDYKTYGELPTLDEGANLSITAPVWTHPGGIGNGIPVAAKLFPGAVGAATLLGDDPNGRAFFHAMEDAGVDTGGIRWNSGLPERPYEILDARGKPVTIPKEQLSTGMSFICEHPTTGDPLIFFSPGINQVIDETTIDTSYLSSARAVIISYGTLLRALDRNGGEPMAGLIRDLKARDVLMVLDTHSIKGADYGVLDKPLREVDVFGCNIGEARGITGLGEGATPEELLAGVAAKMNVDGGSSRLVAMTMKDNGSIVAYYPPGGKEPLIASAPAVKVEVLSGTGAGDTFKAGLVAYVVENMERFRNGTLDAREAAQFGNATAASYISGKGTENVGTFEQTMDYMRQKYPQALSIEPPGLPQAPGRKLTQ